MEFITIKKNGKIIKQTIMKGEKKEEKIDSLKDYLGVELEFEKGLKFKTLFKLILKEKEFFNILYKQELGNMKLDDFEKQLSKRETCKSNKNEDGDIMESLEITKMFELLNFEKGSTIDLFSVFVGVGISNESPEEIYMPVSLIPINNLKNYEIYINKAVEIFKSPSIDSIEDEEPLLITNSSITLYEAFQAIIYEIAYFGTAENKIKEKEKIEKEYKIENKIFELETSLQVFVNNEEYEKAAKIKKELDRLKK